MREGRRGILGDRNCMCELTEEAVDVAQARGHQEVLLRVPWEGNCPSLCGSHNNAHWTGDIFLSSTD